MADDQPEVRPPAEPDASVSRTRPLALVVGDIVLAWDMLHPTGMVKRDLAYDAGEAVAVYRQSAGAWATTRILAERRGAEWDVRGVDIDTDEGPRPFRLAAQAYHLWSRFDRTSAGEGDRPWRVTGYLGTHKASPELARAHWEDWDDREAKAAPAKISLIAVVDDDMGFRDIGVPKLMERLSTKAAEAPDELPWVVWKQRGADPKVDVVRTLSGPDAPSDGLESLREGLGARTVAVISSTELRKSEYRISADRSWEGVASEAFESVVNNELLSKVAWVVVSFAAVGALVVEPRARRAFLLYDPTEMEGTWMSRYPGDMVGLTTCIFHDVADALMARLMGGGAPDQSMFEGALRAGITRTRILWFDGYGSPETIRAERSSQDYLLGREQKRIDDDNPTNRVLSYELRFDDESWSYSKLAARLARVTLPVGNLKEWSILAQGPVFSALSRVNAAPPRKIDVAKRIVREGVEAGLSGVPRACYGHLTTADRHEIDAFRAVHGLLDVYLHGDEARPLSIAVFGPPGSGKSFGVKEIARHLGKRRLGDELTFNLSQFGDASMLIGAFHQVRDVALLGKPPLVFWDEFDTALQGAPLGWLRYFLAPMQDGKFQEGQVTHPIGRAVFVFAGGTRHSFAQFSEANGRDDAAKVPDFLSRLRGFLDVRGIAEDPDGEHLIRRALLLHGLLGKVMPGVARGKGYRVDEEVLDMLLCDAKYKHGARSMEAILRMSNVRGTRVFSRSCLPSASQLCLHLEQ